jgi:hypothetical protein
MDIGLILTLGKICMFFCPIIFIIIIFQSFSFCFYIYIKINACFLLAKNTTNAAQAITRLLPAYDQLNRVPKIRREQQEIRGVSMYFGAPQ